MSIQFTAEVFQNRYLPQGSSQVHAIMTVAAESDQEMTFSSLENRLFGIICDTSGSMEGEKLQAAKAAMSKLIELLPEDAYFFIVTGSGRAELVQRVSQALPNNKNSALAAIKRIGANGQTKISNWLAKALEQFCEMPNTIKQALLLTDGHNAPGDQLALERVLQECEGVFQCDCRGVGTDWNVSQLQSIASKLLGTTDIIAHPSQMQADFQAILEKAMNKDVRDVSLRLWTPQNADTLFCKQVSPEIVDLTQRGNHVKQQVVDYPTGAWGKSESRDFHFCISVNPGNVGDEVLAGRASLICNLNGIETKVAEARILAIWSDDEAKSTKIDRRVAHYTGQAELAQVIQEGLEARNQGNLEVATAKLGRAVQIAHQSGNESTAKLLKNVVEIEDASTGTVKIKKTIAKEDEMMLETRSTKTTRIPKSS